MLHITDKCMQTDYFDLAGTHIRIPKQAKNVDTTTHTLNCLIPSTALVLLMFLRLAAVDSPKQFACVFGLIVRQHRYTVLLQGFLELFVQAIVGSQCLEFALSPPLFYGKCNNFFNFSLNFERRVIDGVLSSVPSKISSKISPDRKTDRKTQGRRSWKLKERFNNKEKFDGPRVKGWALSLSHIAGIPCQANWPVYRGAWPYFREPEPEPESTVVNSVNFLN